MPATETRHAELLEKANTLPALPGIYIMRDKSGKVIYVGKAKRLKFRVSQYFQNSRKDLKTTKLVRNIEEFDYFVCNTEIEALTLENTFIKQYGPKYNIKLKDAKSYPYIKVTNEEYPRVVYTRTRLADKARYYGPFSGTTVVYPILDIVHKTLGIPSCKRVFPRDIGKDRPCLYYQMKQCCGLCTGKVTKEEYSELIRCAQHILGGSIKDACATVERSMADFAENENYEAAAKCRDTVLSLQKLGDKQNVVADPNTEQDIFGIYSDDICFAVSVVYIRGGAISDKTDYVFGADTIYSPEAVQSFIVEHYRLREYIPRDICLSEDIGEENMVTLSEYLTSVSGNKAYVRRPVRGKARELCGMAKSNAEQHAREYKNESERDETTLATLAGLLAIETVPQRIEAYDISNFGADNKTAGMIVVEDGKFKKSDYRTFTIKNTEGIDDYGSLRETLDRRFARLKEETKGAFAVQPDLILLDGGRGHVTVGKQALAAAGLDIPLFGMVKDEFHKTRSLCTADGEINIAREKSVFTFIYKIQEEVHRYSVGRSSAAKRKTLKKSSLENIPGIGPAKARALLAHFGTLTEIKNADVKKLAAAKGINPADAVNIKIYFDSKDKAPKPNPHYSRISRQ